MSLIGTCDDCGASAVPLRHKPDVEHEQTRPSVCQKCAYERDRMMREREQRQRPPHVGPPRVELGGDE